MAGMAVGEGLIGIGMAVGDGLMGMAVGTGVGTGVAAILCIDT